MLSKRPLTIAVLLAAALVTSARGKYLFAYFTGNNPEQEQIMYAVSDDGFCYSPLNGGKPVLASDSIARTGCVRDPHILRTPGGEFLMVATDMRSSMGWDSNRGIVLLKSRDLIHWQHHTVHFPQKYAGTHFANVTRVWAPQTIYDEQAGRYMVYFSLLSNDGSIPYDRVYWAYANADFTDLEGNPQVLFDFHAPAIDADIVRDNDGEYHLFFKTEQDGAHKGIRQYVFRDLHDPRSWTLLDGFCEQTKDNVEGAGVFPLTSGGWCLMYDCYTAGHYQFTRSDDLRSFHWAADTRTSGAFTPRHGTVIQISSKEYKRLVKAFGKPDVSMAAPMDGGLWKDNTGKHINAHGGNIIHHKGTYYWYGESRSVDGKPYSSLGVSCLTSKNLRDWTNHGLVLPVSNEPGSDIEGGCIIERPKVLYNALSGKFVMWMHLELKGQGYGAARAAVAVGDSPLGPFRFIRSGRVNAGRYPIGFAQTDSTDLRQKLHAPETRKWWTPEWRRQIERGMFTMRDLQGGQMARDMTVFVDDDGKAYHIYSSEDNLTIQIAQLTDDYLEHNGSYVRVAAGGMNEAPTIFKQDGTYWMITSGCTGWAPNAARMFRAKNIFGPWEQLHNPCRGDGADKTFGAQGTYIYKVESKAEKRLFRGADYVFMADIWNPGHLSESRHLWIPITFEDGMPVLRR